MVQELLLQAEELIKGEIWLLPRRIISSSGQRDAIDSTVRW